MNILDFLKWPLSRVELEESISLIVQHTFISRHLTVFIGLLSSNLRLKAHFHADGVRSKDIRFEPQMDSWCDNKVAPAELVSVELCNVDQRVKMRSR